MAWCMWKISARLIEDLEDVAQTSRCFSYTPVLDFAKHANPDVIITVHRLLDAYSDTDSQDQDTLHDIATCIGKVLSTACRRRAGTPPPDNHPFPFETADWRPPVSRMVLCISSLLAVCGETRSHVPR